MRKHLDWLTEEEKLKRLSAATSRVYEAIKANWPTNPLEVAHMLGDNGKEKSLSAKYIYHFRKLKKLGLIMIKKMGNTYVAWPNEIEKLRIIRDMVREV
jgi:predicted transcriptional regulator